jgi:hypothetical protein
VDWDEQSRIPIAVDLCIAGFIAGFGCKKRDVLNLSR